MLVRHLYLHVPFCLRRCSYCDFAVHPTRRPPVREWLDAIPRELALLQQAHPDLRLELDTIYIGGGTPSLLGTGAMQTLLEQMRGLAQVNADAEITAEANPENLTVELAADWRAAGINRVSIGIQTFHEPALRWMGRLHGAEGALNAVAAARAGGFENINVDLIFALPSNLARDWTRDLALTLELAPQHISLYGLSAENEAALGRWVREGRAVLPADDAYADQYLEAAHSMTAAGYHHYEVSNFARPGCESRHNRAYWSGAAYIGLGPGAHSLLPPERHWNVRGWPEYQSSLAAGVLPIADRETIEGDVDQLERIWLGLRTAEGAPLTNDAANQASRLSHWQQAGWAEVTEDRIRLTPEGWLLLDRLAVELASGSA